MTTDLSVLDVAKEKMLDGNWQLAASMFHRALDEGIPKSVVDMRAMTKCYLIFPLECYTAADYFSALMSMKNLASKDDVYKNEYYLALNSLVNIKTMILRELALKYFSEIAVCYQNSSVIAGIHELLKYINDNINDIVYNDIYDIKYNLKIQNLDFLWIDLMKIKAYCANILLSYCAVQNSVYNGKSYTAQTIDYGYYMSTSVTARDNYTNYAILKPRLNMIGLEAYYDVYLNILNQTTDTIRKYCKFSSADELREEITKMVELKKIKRTDDFYRFYKQFEKNDVGRSSIIKDLVELNPFKHYLKYMYKKFLGMDEVGSFELDAIFARKKLLGVCDMISCSTHMNLFTVRWLMAAVACFGGIGVFAYLILAIAMKCGIYLPGITIVKH